MKIATFNINNVVRRLPNLLAWLRAAEPDVVCLQELATRKPCPLSARDSLTGAFRPSTDFTWQCILGNNPGLRQGGCLVIAGQEEAAVMHRTAL